MNKHNDLHKIIVGRAEVLSFVEHDILQVPAKVDSGAYRSAVHASNIKLIEGDTKLSFELLGGHKVCGSMSKTIITDKFTQVKISNSFGQDELRYEVSLRVKLGPKLFLTGFSLADRSKKIYPILLGRKLLNGRFLIDTSQTRIDRIELKSKYGISFPSDEEEQTER